jgi:integrase
MTKRRTHGDGGIDERGENSWRLRYRVNGRRFTKAFHGTLSEARKALRDLLHAGDTGRHVAPDKVTLGDWIEHWLGIGAPGESGGVRSVHAHLNGTANFSAFTLFRR